MVKFFVKNTEQEVKIGNKLKVKVPVHTPYGESVCEVETIVTQASLEQLVKDGIIERREIIVANPDDYRMFVRRLARKMEISFADAAEYLDILKQTSMYAHNCLLSELMADVMNRGKEFGKYAYVLNFGPGKPIVQVFNKNVDMPKFTCMEDAHKAAILLTPFVLAYRNDRK